MVLLLGMPSITFAQVGAGMASPGWRSFEIPEYGTRIDIPGAILSPAPGKPSKGVGEQFESSDRRAILRVYARENEAGETPLEYARKNLHVDRAWLDYERITRSFVAVSMERDGLIYYSRCNFSGGARGVMHCFDLVYPQEEKRAWDPVVTRISLSLRPREPY